MLHSFLVLELSLKRAGASASSLYLDVMSQDNSLTFNGIDRDLIYMHGSGAPTIIWEPGT